MSATSPQLDHPQDATPATRQKSPIPSGWQRVELGKLIAERKQKVVPAIWDDRPYIALEHIAQGEPVLTGQGVASDAASAKTVFSAGDILFGKLRPNLKKCVRVDFDGVCSTDILALYARDGQDPQYLSHLIASHHVTGFAARTAIGTKMPRTSWPALAEYPVLAPPPVEQQMIGAILTSVDDAIERTRGVIDQARQLKTALLQDLLTHGLPGKHSEFTEHKLFGEMPADWKVVRLRAVSDRITDGVHASVKTVDNGHPFLYVSCVRDGKILWGRAASITDSTYRDISPGRVAKPGGVLYTVVGSFGHAALVHDKRLFSFQRHIGYVETNQDLLRSAYLVHWLNCDKGRREANRIALGGAQKTITLQELGRFPVPLPSIEEQDEIVSLLTATDARVEQEMLRLAGLVDTKAALCQALLTGRVRVNTGRAKR